MFGGSLGPLSTFGIRVIINYLISKSLIVLFSVPVKNKFKLRSKSTLVLYLSTT